MSNQIKSAVTRFRGYQLGQAGSSFSYFDGATFTLIEGVATEMNQSNILEEMKICGKTAIDCLHITSWDADHCSNQGLQWILDKLRPVKIEFPGYAPHTDCGNACLDQIRRYQAMPRESGQKVKAICVDPPFIISLGAAAGLGYNDIFYHPRAVYKSPNDNSSVKFFRGGMFNVLSLGDVEHSNIGAMLRRCKILCRETDLMILAHHGADNGITTKALLECIRPKVAICSSNYDNQYSHPPQAIRDLLYEQGVQLVTTKTGDVVVSSLAPHRFKYRVENFKANSTAISSVREYDAKKVKLLSANSDSVRNTYNPGFKGIRK